jgi:succinoglycan biosynthesis transport protein ExoP
VRAAEERAQGYLVRGDDPLVEIVDAAAVSPDPVRPRKEMNLAVCPAAGLLIGWGLALLRYPARRTIRGLEDVEEQLKLPVLGVIPKKNP